MRARLRIAAISLLLLGGSLLAASSPNDVETILHGQSFSKVLPRGYIIEFADDAEQQIAMQSNRSVSSVKVHREFHEYMCRSIAAMHEDQQERKRSVLDALTSAFSSVKDDSEASSRYTTRYEIDHAGLFRGVSVVLSSDSYAGLLATAPGVSAVSPIRMLRPRVSLRTPTPDDTSHLSRRGDQKVDTLGALRMTGFDRVHSEGFLGQGTIIGIIDTGERVRSSERAHHLTFLARYRN